MKEQEDLSNEIYKNGCRRLHSTFSTPQGKEALAFLESLFGAAYFDPNNPRDKALFTQGQASVMHEIKDSIYKVDNNFFEKE